MPSSSPNRSTGCAWLCGFGRTGIGLVGFLGGNCALCSCGPARPTSGIPPEAAIRFCMGMLVLLLTRRGGCGGGASSRLPPCFAGDVERLRFRPGKELFTLDVARRARPGNSVSGPCTVDASDTALVASLVSGDTEPVRCAGFLATGGGDFCFAACVWDTAGFDPMGGLAAVLLTGFRFC
jgi:hypothetical protein